MTFRLVEHKSSAERLYFQQCYAMKSFSIKLQFLHFANHSQYDANDPNHNRLHKARHVDQYLVSTFKSVYISENISIDGELLLWKKKLLFKQSKSWNQDVQPPWNCRLPLELICLLHKELVAATTDMEMVRLGKSGAFIPWMMGDLLGKGHKLCVQLVHQQRKKK